MNLRRALFDRRVPVAARRGAAAAQAPWPQQPVPRRPLGRSSSHSRSSRQQRQSRRRSQQPQQPPCIQEFVKLRDDAEKRGRAIRHASQRKASPKEACASVQRFTAAEAKMIKYAVDNRPGAAFRRRSSTT